MVWRVDAAAKPVELRGFASGTLIRDRVIVTAGHFTAPAKALGALPPSLRIFASFSPSDAKDPKTWTQPVIRLGMYSQRPFVDAANTPILHARFDELVGRNKWLPCKSMGTFPVRCFNSFFSCYYKF